MIKTAIKILLALAVLNALVRAGLVAWDYFQLKDATQQIIVFGSELSTNQIAQQIYTEAEELEVPVERGNIEVQREGNRTFVDIYYVDMLEVFPNLLYPLELSLSVEAFSVRPAITDDVK